MYGTYSGTKSGLTVDDIAGIQSIYSNGGTRTPDQFGGGDTSFWTAANLSGFINGSNQTALVTSLNLTTAGEKEYYSVVAPLSGSSTVTFSVQSSGLSLLAPTITVYAADQTTVLGYASGAGQYGATVTLNLTNKISAGQYVYIKVTGADTSAFSTGDYALRMSFAGAPLPVVPLPNTQTPNGTPLSGGGGLANADALEYQIGPPTVGTIYLTSADSPEAVAMDSQGNYVVTWSAYDPVAGWSVDAQLFAADTTPLSAPFQVNTLATGQQRYATAAMDAQGDFVITWSSYGQDGDGWSIFAQRYDAAGNPVGREFQVNTPTAGNQQFSTVAMDAQGDFVVTWLSTDAQGNSLGIDAQRYDAAGNRLGGQLQVTPTANSQAAPGVAMDAQGNYVVTWSSPNPDGTWGVYGHRYDLSGDPLGATFQVNTTTTGDQQYPTVGINGAGSFVIAWSANLNGHWQVEAQRYDASGNPLGGEFQVNTTTTGAHLYPTVGVDTSGDFLVTWTTNGGGVSGDKTVLFQGQNTTNGWSDSTTGSTTSLTNNWNIYGQQFSGDDSSPVGTEFHVNTTTTGNHQYSSLAMVNGHIAVAWSGSNLRGGTSVFVQIYTIGADALSAPDGNDVAASSSVEQIPAVPPTTLRPTMSWTSSVTGQLPPGLAPAGSGALFTPPAAAPAHGGRLFVWSADPSPEPGEDGAVERTEDQPDLVPAEASRDVGLQPVQSISLVQVGAAQDLPGRDTALAAEAWRDTGAAAESAQLALDPGALVLALTGLLGSYHLTQPEGEEHWRRQQHVQSRNHAGAVPATAP